MLAAPRPGPDPHKAGVAGAEHVNSAHFRNAMSWMPDLVADTLKIINARTEGDGWGAMSEVQLRR